MRRKAISARFCTDYLPGVPTVAAKKIGSKKAKRASSSEAEDVNVNLM
jgi:hypothetical protein